MPIEKFDPTKHDVSTFACGEHSLDRYLKKHAALNQEHGISTTHVLVESGRVVGYFSLSAAQLELSALQESDRGKLPKYPVPAVRMGRLAVSKDEQGKGYGERLVGHAVMRSLEMRDTLGVRVMIVDSLPAAEQFYLSYGFQPTTDNPSAFYLPLGV